ncbi:MAG TPA: Ig-like domain-containing protein [Candidatus Binatia bacterium]|nr:Ig-like domain-containing protein [Candidatus Binatia bacterium]
MVEELIFQLRRDDGAVVYINGLEYYRSNMPPGAITSSTLASADAVGLDEQQAFITTVQASGLLIGTNVIAVEVHQSAPTSSDVGFDLHLTASGDTSPRILLSRPGNGQAFVLPATVDIEAAAWPGQSRVVSKVEFYGDGNRLGEATAAPYVYQWVDVPQGNHTVFARMTDSFGDVLQSRAVNISAGYEIIRTNFIAAGSVWKYRDINSNEGTNFAQFNYNDNAWASGPAQLGYGDGDEATTVNGGPTGARYITTYFRRMFQCPSAWTITNLSFRLVRDDGAVVWLNEREQLRSNMPGGAINYTTLASAAVDGANENAEASFTITNLPLNNLVAVEIHQSGPGSSDISFDLELVGTGYVTPVVRPTLKIVRLPEGPVRITWPASQTGWTVYSSPSVTGGWLPSGDVIGVSNNLNNVIAVPTNPTTFYELRRP